MKSKLPKWQFISQGDNQKEQYDSILKALDGGCQWIQLRYKNNNDLERTSLAERIKKSCDQYQSMLIINDFPLVAKHVDADGVHLGLKDHSVMSARQLLGDQKIIGGTANTWSHIVQRHEEGCDYIGLGPFKFTETKSGLSPILGLNAYEELQQRANKEHLLVPFFAIGGITLKDLTDLKNTQIYGIAVSGLIISAEDVLKTVHHIKIYFS